jgi:hypothetical protein
MSTIVTRDGVELYYKDAVLLGFSTGGGEVARYIGRHGTHRVARAGLIPAVPGCWCMQALPMA